jgi:hypothetical protein
LASVAGRSRKKTAPSVARLDSRGGCPYTGIADGGST